MLRPFAAFLISLLAPQIWAFGSLPPERHLATSLDWLAVAGPGQAPVRLNEWAGYAYQGTTRAPWGEQEIDLDGDGMDDRVLEQVALVGEDVSSVLLIPDLGLAYVGGRNVGLNGLSLGPPRLAVLSAAAGSWLGLPEVAPYGVPSVLRGGVELPGWIRLEADLSSMVAAGGTLQLDLVSLGPSGLEIDGAGPSEDVPATSCRGAAGYEPPPGRFVSLDGSPW